MASELTRPFAVRVDTSGRADELDVWMDFEEPVGDPARVAVTEVMATFAALGATGGLSGASREPARGSITQGVRDLTKFAGHWVYENVLIDPAAFCVLLNMIHWVHVESIGIRELRVRWEPIGQLGNPMEIQFPGRWPRLSFALDIGDLIDDVDLDIEFEAPQAEEVTERVVEVMSRWLLASHRGAYGDESFDPPRSCIYLGPDVMDVSPERITWFIEVLRCSESALDGIANVLEWVHHKVAPIRRVEIGP